MTWIVKNELVKNKSLWSRVVPKNVYQCGDRSFKYINVSIQKTITIS